MFQSIKTLSRSGGLILAWTGRIIRSRYQQSVLGWLWAIVQPIAMAAIFTVVFTYFVPVDTGEVPYLIFSYSAVVPWTLVAASLPDMSISLVQNMNLVTKIYLPREVLPISAMLARLMDFAIAMIILFAMFIPYHMSISLNMVLYLPIILVIQIALILGVGIASAAINVFYRDTDPFLRLVIQLWFYASPIVYSVNMVPENLRGIYYLNPMAAIIQSYRNALVYNVSPEKSLWFSAISAVIILFAGYTLFKKMENQFADII